MSVRQGGCCARLCFCFRCCFFKGPVGLKPFLLGSKVNILFFVCAPLAFVAEANHWDAGITFVLAMLAIAPLAERLGYLTEQLAHHTNDTLGGMMNATFGNSVETLISVIALLRARKAREENDPNQAAFFLTLIQTSLLGSMLSNLLLVQGSAFFIGGLRHPLQRFSRDGAITSAGLLVLATLALSVPTMLWSQQDQVSPTEAQLRTHRFLFERASEIHKAGVEFEVVTSKAAQRIASLGNRGDESFVEVELTPTATRVKGAGKDLSSTNESSFRKSGGLLSNRQAQGAGTSDNMDEELGGTIKDLEDITRPPLSVPDIQANGGRHEFLRSQSTDSEQSAANDGFKILEHVDHEEAEIGLVFCMLYLVISTVAVAFVSHVVVEAAEGAVNVFHLNEAFVGGVVVPIVGNAAEHASALMFAWRDKMDTALAIAVGSAIQIPLFVMPVCVLVGWAAEVPMTLNLDQFMMTIVVVTSLALAFNLHAGSSHWLHGLILIFEYLIIAAAFWFK